MVFVFGTERGYIGRKRGDDEGGLGGGAGSLGAQVCGGDVEGSGQISLVRVSFPRRWGVIHRVVGFTGMVCAGAERNCLDFACTHFGKQTIWLDI